MSTLNRISLKEYLMNIERYTDLRVKSDGRLNGSGIFVNRDFSILTSSQATVLPLRDGTTEFNVRVHNYQYDAVNPAVLCIVVSPHGTSAQLLTEYKQKLYFNNQGSQSSYVAERLTDQRIRAGKPTAGPMTQEEQERNVLFIFQVPLKQKREAVLSNGGFYAASTSASIVEDNDEMGGYGSEECYVNECFGSNSPPRQARGIDHAQLKISEKSHGAFSNASSINTIERDDRFPIRCTIQYYYVTDTAKVPREVISKISNQVWKHYKATDEANRGSLVVGGKSNRVTVPVPDHTSALYIPQFTSPFFAF